MNRVDRLMNILWMIQAQKTLTLQKISKKFDLSERTIYRDIKALNEIGIPIYFEHDKGYSIMSGYFLPPLAFTLEEANALLLLQSLAKKFSDKLIAKNAESAIRKISAVLKTKELEKIHEISSRTEVYDSSLNENAKNYLSDVQSAIINKIILDIKYTDSNSKKTSRKIEPVGMIFYTNQWHVIAWCWLRKDYRDFKIGCINELGVTGTPYKKVHTYTVQDYMKIF